MFVALAGRPRGRSKSGASAKTSHACPPASAISKTSASAPVSSYVTASPASGSVADTSATWVAFSASSTPWLGAMSRLKAGASFTTVLAVANADHGPLPSRLPALTCTSYATPGESPARVAVVPGPSWFASVKAPTAPASRCCTS